MSQPICFVYTQAAITASDRTVLHMYLTDSWLIFLKALGSHKYYQ